MRVNIHEFFLTFFYLGKSKKAPGTVGSFASVIFWFLVTKYFFDQQIPLATQNIFWAILLTITFIYGSLAIPIYAKKTGEIDHGSIVLDEFVGQVLALQFTFYFLQNGYFWNSEMIFFHLFFCFISFRFFDIKKPSLIGYCDRNFKSGFGVMLDDLLAGAITTAIFQLILAILTFLN